MKGRPSAMRSVRPAPRPAPPLSLVKPLATICAPALAGRNLKIKPFGVAGAVRLLIANVNVTRLPGRGAELR
jgi:hypothetical protein